MPSIRNFKKSLADYKANLNTMLDAVRQNTERELHKCSKTLKSCKQMLKPPSRPSKHNYGSCL